jgi:Ion channel
VTQASLARRAVKRRDRTGRAERGGRYGVLLLVLISTYLLSAFSHSMLTDYFQLALFLALLLLALRTAMVGRRTAQLAGAVALLGSAAALGAALTRTQAGVGAADMWKGLILLVSVVLIVRRVLARPTVTVQSIYGALSAYMIIGLMFAAFYAAIWRLGGGSFFVGQQTAEHQTDTQTLQYFSFTTLTTLGYGDFTAANNGGRAVAVMEALLGQVFLATLVARLVASFRVPAERAPVSTRSSPSTVRRGAALYRKKLAGNARRASSRLPSAPAPRRTGAGDRVPGPGLGR